MFQDVIKDLRVQKGLTTDEVALEVGVSGGAYRNYERGERTPDFVKLVKLADFYGVSVDYLLGREEAPDPIEQLATLSSMEVTEQVLLEKYLELPKASRKIVINFMKSAIAEAEARKGQEKPSIQLHEGQRLAVARTDDPDRLYRPAPTEEQLKSFTPCTPDMLGEDE